MIAITNQLSAAFPSCLTSIQPRPSIDLALAQEQHARYRDWLASHGARVIHLDVNQGQPDGVFVEDTAVITPELAVITPMGAPERAAEPRAIAQELARHKPVFEIHPPAKLEGGDVLRVGKRIWVGLTQRSDKPGIAALQEALGDWGYEVRGVPLKGCLHLKSAVTALDQERLVLNPEMVDPVHFEGLQWTPVHPGEPFAGNVLSLKGSILANAAYPHTAQKLRDMGYEVGTLEISEFMKADAALTCPSLILDD